MTLYCQELPPLFQFLLWWKFGCPFFLHQFSPIHIFKNIILDLIMVIIDFKFAFFALEVICLCTLKQI